MITIIAKSIVKNGKKEEYLKLINELIEGSRKEEGCISYRLYEDINNPNILTLIEEWKDEEAIKIHNNTQHYLEIVPKLRELREKDVEINMYKLKV